MTIENLIKDIESITDSELIKYMKIERKTKIEYILSTFLNIINIYDEVTVIILKKK